MARRCLLCSLFRRIYLITPWHCDNTRNSASSSYYLLDKINSQGKKKCSTCDIPIVQCSPLTLLVHKRKLFSGTSLTSIQDNKSVFTVRWNCFILQSLHHDLTLNHITVSRDLYKPVCHLFMQYVLMPGDFSTKGIHMIRLRSSYFCVCIHPY